MRGITSKDLFEMKWVGDPQVSPDGKMVLFTVKSIIDDEKTKTYKTQIYLAKGGDVRQFTFGPKNDTTPRWSPKGDRVAFLSERGKDKTQLYLIDLNGGEAVQISHRKDGVGEPLWSPDGKKVAFVATVEDPKDDKMDEKEKSDVRVITKIRYKLNGRGFLPDKPSHVHILDVETGSVTQLTQGDKSCREPAWSPDGKYIAYVASAGEDDDEFSSYRDIYVIPVEGGEAKKVTAGNAVLGGPSWSPCGKYIACYGHDDEMKGATTPGVCLVEVETGALTFLTKEKDLCVGQSAGSDMGGSPPTRATWSKDGKHLFFSALRYGRTHIYKVDVSSREITQVTSGDCVVFGWHKAEADDTLALCVTNPALIGDVFLLDQGGENGAFSGFGAAPSGDFALSAEAPYCVRRLTEINKDPMSGIALSRPKEFYAVHPDGTKVQSWIMKPLGAKDGVKYPLLLEIHGGPHAAYGFTFFHEFQFLAARGYGVVYSNPRGSVGVSQDFTAAIKHDWGGVDYQDLMAVVDHALAEGWVDEKRMGVLGGSYGGYMTNWVVTQTKRFAAAVTMRSTCNRMSQFGASDAAYRNGEFEFDGDPWDNHHSYLDRSPIMYVRNVETPILIIHSEQDLRCPMEQAEEWFTALKKTGKTAVFVRFPNENHELSRSGKPIHRIERLEFIAAWFDRYVGPVDGDYSVPLAKPEKPVVKIP